MWPGRSFPARGLVSLEPPASPFLVCVRLRGLLTGSRPALPHRGTRAALSRLRRWTGSVFSTSSAQNPWASGGREGKSARGGRPSVAAVSVISHPLRRVGSGGRLAKGPGPHEGRLAAGITASGAAGVGLSLSAPRMGLPPPSTAPRPHRAPAPGQTATWGSRRF